MRKSGVAKKGKAWLSYPSHAWIMSCGHRGVWPKSKNMFKNRPKKLRRSSESLDYSCGVFEPSWLGDEQLQALLKRLQPPPPPPPPTPTPRPPCVHLTSLTWPFFAALPHPYYCQRKPKNRKNRVGLGTRLAHSGSCTDIGGGSIMGHFSWIGNVGLQSIFNCVWVHYALSDRCVLRVSHCIIIHVGNVRNRHGPDHPGFWRSTDSLSKQQTLDYQFQCHYKGVLDVHYSYVHTV